MTRWPWTEAELTERIGAAPHERSAERSNVDNRPHPHPVDHGGDLELWIPKLRHGPEPAPDQARATRRVREVLEPDQGGLDS